MSNNLFCYLTGDVCLKHKITNRHWYDDSYWREMQGSQAFLPVMNCCYYNKKDLLMFFSGMCLFYNFICIIICWNFFNARWNVLQPVQRSVLNQLQQSIHKHSLPAASGASHKGLRVSANMTQLPGLRATTQEKQLNLSSHRHSCFACLLLFQGQQEKQNTSDLYLHLLRHGQIFTH